MTRPPQAALELRVAPPHELGRGLRRRRARHEAAQPPRQPAGARGGGGTEGEHGLPLLLHLFRESAPEASQGEGHQRERCAHGERRERDDREQSRDAPRTGGLGRRARDDVGAPGSLRQLRRLERVQVKEADQPGDGADQRRAGEADGVGDHRQHVAQDGAGRGQDLRDEVHAQGLGEKEAGRDDEQRHAEHGQQPGPRGRPFLGRCQGGERLVPGGRDEQAAGDERDREGFRRPRGWRAADRRGRQHEAQQREGSDAAARGDLGRERRLAEPDADEDEEGRVDDVGDDPRERVGRTQA